jgi:hypothetical protein
VVVKDEERTLVLFMLTGYYQVFREVAKKIMNTIGCHKGPADRELTLELVEHMENTIQYIGAGGICGAHPPILSDLLLSFFVSSNRNKFS